MIIGDVVRWYFNPTDYITGVIVADCGDGVFEVEYNGEQRKNYKENELILDNQLD